MFLIPNDCMLTVARGLSLPSLSAFSRGCKRFATLAALAMLTKLHEERQLDKLPHRHIASRIREIFYREEALPIAFSLEKVGCIYRMFKYVMFMVCTQGMHQRSYIPPALVDKPREGELRIRKISCSYGEGKALEPTIGPNQTLYVASKQNLIALSFHGVEKWHRCFWGKSISTSPAVRSDGVIYVGMTQGEENHLCVLNPAGEEFCSYWVQGREISALVISEERRALYFTVSTDGYYERPFDGTLTHHSLGRLRNNYSVPPFIKGNFLFLISDNGYLVIKDLQSSACIVERPIDRRGVIAHPSITGDHHDGYISANHFLYHYSFEGGEFSLRQLKNFSSIIDTDLLVRGKVAYFGTSSKHFYAFDLETRTTKWVFTQAQGGLTSPTMTMDGMVYFGSKDRQFYQIDSITGELHSKTTLSRPIHVAPAIIGSLVYCISHGGGTAQLCVLDI